MDGAEETESIGANTEMGLKELSEKLAAKIIDEKRLNHAKTDRYS